MKKLSVLLVLSLLMITSTYAQKSPEERASKTVDHLTEALNLTADQQVQVKALYVEKYTHKQAAKAERKEGVEMDKEARKLKREEMRKSFDDRLAQILTPEQMEKKATLKSEKKSKMKGHKKGDKAMKGKGNRQLKKADRRQGKAFSPEKAEKKAQKSVDRMTKQLNLSPDQGAEIKQSYLEFYSALNQLNTTKGGDRAAMKEEKVALSKAFREKVDSVLTPEQREIRKGKRAKRAAKKEAN